MCCRTLVPTPSGRFRAGPPRHDLWLGNQIDGALLDVNLGNEAIWPVVDALLARHVPLVLATGYDASAIPPAYAGLPRCEKPATGQELVRALARTLAA